MFFQSIFEIDDNSQSHILFRNVLGLTHELGLFTMVMTKTTITTITTIVFSLQQKLINVVCLASKVVGEVHQICTRNGSPWNPIKS
jgi:hypothetical protein